ncbi:hypothetical protein DFJ73DRAFT_54239 [Zopfochytrium polystomum]|nr:hypothetical protein DFJ73DRAFT_54239 [Zopfochytrium polystomum]
MDGGSNAGGSGGAARRSFLDGGGGGDSAVFPPAGSSVFPPQVQIFNEDSQLQRFQFQKQSHPGELISEQISSDLDVFHLKEMDEFDDLEDSSARMVDWVVGSSPQDDDDDGFPIGAVSGLSSNRGIPIRLGPARMADSSPSVGANGLSFGSPLDPRAAVFNPSVTSSWAGNVLGVDSLASPKTFARAAAGGAPLGSPYDGGSPKVPAIPRKSQSNIHLSLSPYTQSYLLRNRPSLQLLSADHPSDPPEQLASDRLYNTSGPVNLGLEYQRSRGNSNTSLRQPFLDLDNDVPPFERGDLSNAGSASWQSQGDHRARTTSALSAGLAAVGRLGVSRIVEPTDEGTPTPFSVHFNVSHSTVPEFSLPGAYGASPGRRGHNEPSMPIAISDRQPNSAAVSFSRSPHYLTPSSWGASFGPSSFSSDEGGLASSSYGNVRSQQKSHMSVSVPGFSKKPSQGSFRQALPARMGASNAALFQHDLGDDGCPILTVPRKVFWNSGGTMTVPNRVWKKGGAEKADNRHFMVMSYNVLAPMYCTENRYPLCEPQFLEWEHRKRKILDEIALHAPDFVCLQELPPPDFKEVFLPELQKIGYDGHFQQKKKAHAADGSAIFYLESRFSLMAVQAFAYSDQIPQDPSSDLFQRLSPFPNVALICVFQNRQARSLRVRVVNTHLHWDPAYADTKLLQAAILMEWLERTHRDVPTVIAADLNSRPGEAVVDFLVRGKVAPGPLFGDRDFGRFTASLTLSTRNPYMMHSAAKEGDSLKPSSTAPSGATPPTVSPLSQPQPLPLLRHGTKLASAYDRKDLPFTNKTGDFEGCIDHILYTSGTLSIRDVLGDFDNALLNAQEAKEKNDVSAVEDEVIFDEEIDAKTKEEDLTSKGLKHLDHSTAELEPSVSPIPAESDDEAKGAGDALSETESHEALSSPLPKGTAIGTASGKSAPYPAGPAPPQPQGFLARVKSLPTENVPSDHLPLCAWLKWKTVPVGTGPISLSSSTGDRTRSRGGRRGGGGHAGSSAAAASSTSSVSSNSVTNGSSLSANPIHSPSIISTSAPAKPIAFFGPSTFAAAAATPLNGPGAGGGSVLSGAHRVTLSTSSTATPGSAAAATTVGSSSVVAATAGGNGALPSNRPPLPLGGGVSLLSGLSDQQAAAAAPSSFVSVRIQGPR